MAEVVNINPDNLIHAANKVADHLAAAALPPAGALPPGMAPSPADVAAEAVDKVLQAKIASASTEMADEGPTLTGATVGATWGLEAQDAADASRIASVEEG